MQQIRKLRLGTANIFQTFEDLESINDKAIDIHEIRELLDENTNA